MNWDGTWKSASEQLAQEAISYFSNLFTSSQATYQLPGITCKKILTNNARENLCKPFHLEEIKVAVFQIDGNSTLGP